MTNAQKQPVVLSLVLAVVGGSIYLAAQHRVNAQQHVAGDQARQLGDVSLQLATTFGEMKRRLGPPETVIVPTAQQGHVMTKEASIRQAGWHAALVVAQFRVQAPDVPRSVIPEDSAPLNIEIRAPFRGSLDGRRLGGACRTMSASFDPLSSGRPMWNCGE